MSWRNRVRNMIGPAQGMATGIGAMAGRAGQAGWVSGMAGSVLRQGLGSGEPTPEDSPRGAGRAGRRARRARRRG